MIGALEEAAQKVIGFRSAVDPRFGGSFDYHARELPLQLAAANTGPRRSARGLEACGYLRVHAMHMGSILGASGNFTSARTCFDLAVGACFEYLNDAAAGLHAIMAKDTVNRLRWAQGNPVFTEIDQCLLSLRLANPRMGDEVRWGDPRKALAWYAEAAPFYVDWFKGKAKGRLPADLAATITVIPLRLIIYGLGMGSREYVEQGVEQMGRMEDIHRRRLGPDWEREQAKYRSIFMVRMAKAFVEKRVPGFLEHERALAESFPNQGDAPYFNLFWPERVAEYLQAFETMGELGRLEGPCVPPGFEPRAYWNP